MDRSSSPTFPEPISKHTSSVSREDLTPERHDSTTAVLNEALVNVDFEPRRSASLTHLRQDSSEEIISPSQCHSPISSGSQDYYTDDEGYELDTKFNTNNSTTHHPRTKTPSPVTSYEYGNAVDRGRCSPDMVYREMMVDLDIMMETANRMYNLAANTKSQLQTAYHRVDLRDRRVRNLGMLDVMKDLRHESAHSLVDGQRSELRYEKVKSDVKRIVRCLNGMGRHVTIEGEPSTTKIDQAWALPDYSHFYHNL